MRPFAFGFAAFALVLALGATLVSSRMVRLLTAPVDEGNRTTVVVEIPPGAGPEEIARVLREARLVPSPWALETYLNHLRAPVVVTAGEYALSRSMSATQQLEKLRAGDVITYTFTVLPGTTALEVAEALADERFGALNALGAVATRPQSARALGVAAPSLTGFLFPDVYELRRGEDPLRLFGRFVERFRSSIPDSVWKDGETHGLTRTELLALASLVERAGIPPEERRLYARLLLNRRSAGLPPPALAGGLEAWPEYPVVNPSLAAMLAVARPLPTDALYRADGPDGRGIYCPDLACMSAMRARLRTRPGR